LTLFNGVTPSTLVVTTWGASGSDDRTAATAQAALDVVAGATRSRTGFSHAIKDALDNQTLPPVPVYQGVGRGYNSRSGSGADIVLDVTFNGSTVASYSVVSNNESNGNLNGSTTANHAQVGPQWPNLLTAFVGKTVPFVGVVDNPTSGNTPAAANTALAKTYLPLNVPAVDAISGATRSYTGFGKAINDAYRKTLWEDGTYTGTGIGRANSNNVLTLDVTIAGGAITDITYTTFAGENDASHNNEFSVANRDEMKSRVIAAQDWKFDAVAGATMSSGGVSAAVADALEQAYKTKPSTFKDGSYNGQGKYGTSLTVDANVTISSGRISAVTLTPSVATGQGAIVDATLAGHFQTANSSHQTGITPLSGNRDGLRAASLAVADALKKASVATGTGVAGSGLGYHSTTPIVLSVTFADGILGSYTITSHNESVGGIDNGGAAAARAAVVAQWPDIKTIFAAKTLPLAIANAWADNTAAAGTDLGTGSVNGGIDAVDALTGATYSWTGFAKAINDAYSKVGL
jgi:uncharacterized protein with FMN-binding domain